MELANLYKNYVSKKKIREMKKELEEIINMSTNSNYINEVQYAIDILTELLEDN